MWCVKLVISQSALMSLEASNFLGVNIRLHFYYLLMTSIDFSVMVWQDVEQSLNWQGQDQATLTSRRLWCGNTKHISQPALMTGIPISCRQIRSIYIYHFDSKKFIFGNFLKIRCCAVLKIILEMVWKLAFLVIFTFYFS